MKSLILMYGQLGISVLLTVYAQLAIKRHMMGIILPSGFSEKVVFLLCQLTSPLVFSAISAAFIAGLIWMSTVAKHELSLLYPLFISSTIVLVFVLSLFLFNEHLSITKISGLLFIVIGLVITLLGR